MGDVRPAPQRSQTADLYARTPSPTSRPGAPAAALTVSADAGSRVRDTLALQRIAGNRAVAASVAEIAHLRSTHSTLDIVGSPTSTAAPAAAGVGQIAAQATGLRAAGVTSLPAPGAPDLVVGAPLQGGDGRWQATLNSTSVTPDTPISLFPGRGVHDEEPTATGMPVKRDVTAAASDEIKRGEEEHLMDLEWARHLAYDQVADAVNRVAGTGPFSGTTAEQARQAACQAVRTAVPPQARWPTGVDPITHWRRVYGQLVAVTRERDDPNRWHSMTSGFIHDPAEKRRLGVPNTTELVRYMAGTTQVGQHPSEAEVRGRYATLPAGPAGTTAGGTPADALSPAGDYEYKPSDEAYAIRLGRPPA
jgi:hypothetical protein